MRYIVTAEQMRALDAATIDEIGLPGAVLMENAGRRVADVILADLGAHAVEAHVAVVCGGGNNGGDGYVIARVLRERGVSASVYIARDPAAISGDARTHLDVYEQVGGVAYEIANIESLGEHRDAIEGADVVVDAVFGTGLDRPVTGHLAAVIELINRATGVRIAVDIPSGLSADTGQVLGIAVVAHRTVTLAFHKIGTAVSPGFARCGHTIVAEIGIPRQLAQAHGVSTALLERDDVAPFLTGLSDIDHKGTRGHALLVAGSPGKRGAARLAAWAALRTGAGLVTLAAPPGKTEIAAPDPVMTEYLDPDEDGAIARLVGLACDKRAVAIGPGMPTSEAGRALVFGALAELDVPLVLDADALNHVHTDVERVASARPPVVLTPHPGEAARLLGCTTAEVQADRVEVARLLADRARSVVVLKGARTVVCDGISNDGFVTVNTTGNPGLATAGSGDVLTGVITALIAQGTAPADAARLGVWLHGRAGDLAAAALGPRSVTASDVIDELPEALVELDA